MTGQIAIETFRGFHVDKAFVGIGGIHLHAGLTEYNLEDALVKQAILQCAAQVIVVADSSKLQRTCFAAVSPLTEMDVLITDDGAPEDLLVTLSDLGIEIIVAPSQAHLTGHGGDEFQDAHLS